MNNSSLSDDALAELLTLTMEVGQWGSTVYRNQLGQRHRILGPAVINSSGYNAWYVEGQLHRTDGPAIIYPGGDMYWYQNDQLHREDGPAVIYWDGIQRWFLNCKELTQYEFNGRIKSM